MLKKTLREKYNTLRRAVTPASLTSQSISIANKLLELPIWEFEFYHLFLPIQHKKEIDTSSVLSILHGKDKHIVIPKVSESNSLEHFLLTDNTRLKTSKWGVPEPVDGIIIDPKKLDVVFIPLLAFDKVGNRVGYGKGFYDTFLSLCRKDVVKIGLSLFEPEEKITDTHKSDMPLDFCVTPDAIYSFPKS